MGCVKVTRLKLRNSKGPLCISMKISPRRVEKYLIFSTLLLNVRSYLNHYQIVYPKVIYFHKFENLISLKNTKFEFLKVILSSKTMIYTTLYFEPFHPPPLKREVTCQWLHMIIINIIHQAASRFVGRREGDSQNYFFLLLISYWG